MNIIDKISSGFNKFFKEMGEHALAQPHDEVGNFYGNPIAPLSDEQRKAAGLSAIDHEAVNSAAGDFYAHQANQLNND